MFNYLPSSLRIKVRDTLGGVRNSQVTVQMVEPQLVNCTVCQRDEFTNSSSSIPCATCGGTGKTVSNYKRTWFRASAAVVEITQLDIFKGLPPGVESGDYLVWVSDKDLDTVEQAFKDQNAYLLIHGETFRIYGYSADGIGYADEYRLIAKKFKPTYVAP